MDDKEIKLLARTQKHSFKDKFIAVSAVLCIVVVCLSVPFFWYLYLTEEPTMKYESRVKIESTDHVKGGVVQIGIDFCISQDVEIDSINQIFVDPKGVGESHYTTPLLDATVSVVFMKMQPTYRKEGKWHCASIAGSEKLIPANIPCGKWYLLFKNKHKGLLRTHDVEYRSDVFKVCE